MYGVTTQQILDMGSRGELTADIIDAAFSKMTGAGGLYNDMMIRMSETFDGKVSTMASKWEIATAKAGMVLTTILKPAISAIIAIMDFFGETGMTILASLVTGLATVTAAVAAARLAVVF